MSAPSSLTPSTGLTHQGNPLRWGSAALAALAMAVLALVPLGAGIAMCFQHTVTVPHMLVDVAPGAAGIGQAHHVGTADVDVPGLSLGVRLLLAAHPVLQSLAGLVGAWCLACLLRDISRGTPFTEANVRRLLTVTLACLVGGLIAPLVDLVGQMAVTEQGATFRAEATVGLAPMLAAVVAGSLTLAFRRGMRLEQDVEGLV